MIGRLLQCWFGHADRFRERDADGRYFLVCPDCRDRVQVLKGQTQLAHQERE